MLAYGLIILLVASAIAVVARVRYNSPGQRYRRLRQRQLDEQSEKERPV